MKPKFLLYILIMCSTLIACDKMPANGDLDGMWQVMQVEHNGVTKNVAADQLYMSIQLKLFMLGDIEYSRRYFGYFEHVGDSMRLWKFSKASANESGADDNIPVNELDKIRLKQWGFYSVNESFKVDKLTKDILIMHNDSSTIHFIKF